MLDVQCSMFDVHYLLAKLYTKIPLPGWQIDILGKNDPLRFDNRIE
jgi:hypothetical protein